MRLIGVTARDDESGSRAGSRDRAAGNADSRAGNLAGVAGNADSAAGMVDRGAGRADSGAGAGDRQGGNRDSGAGRVDSAAGERETRLFCAKILILSEEKSNERQAETKIRDAFEGARLF